MFVSLTKKSALFKSNKDIDSDYYICIQNLNEIFYFIFAFENHF